MTSFVTVAGIVFATICLSIGAITLAVVHKRPKSGVHRWFALAATLAAANALLEPFAFTADELATHITLFKWVIGIQVLCWISLVWYVSHYSDTARRSLALLVTAAYGIAFLVNAVAPYGALFSEIQGLRVIQLAWGEPYVVPQGAASPWLIVGYGANVLFVVYVIDATVGLLRQGQQHRAWRLGAATGFLLFALVHGSLVDVGILNQPYLMSAAFLGVVVLMGLDLADDAVRAAELSRQVAENDRKWARLLEKAKLLITSLDGQGNVDYVNPFFSNVTGFSADDVVGKPLGELLPSNDRARVSAEFARALDGDGPSSSETHLVTRDGGDRAVHWSHVILSDPDGEAAGLLSIGADVTDQRQAETARDEAMRELEQLKDRLAEENLYLREEIQLDRGGMNMVGESDALAYVRHRIQDVCATGATVLIHGETGVGKELVAHAIHTCSARSDKPFIRVPCAALPPSLIESELFGHVAGAYTGATGERQGRFELADGGTLLLDEVGELPLELQGKLLRVLQEGEFERVGSSTTVHVDVRVLAATNRNLAKEVEAGRFREDLYYRLNVYPITVPPLRDRKSDIPLLVDHLVRSISQRMGRDITEVPAPVLRKLREYDWPGNVRELENVLERAVITSPGAELRLPETLVSAPAETHAPTDSNEDFLRPLRDVEKQHIQRVLENSRGRIAGPGGAAEILGLHPNTLRSRMQKLGVPTGG